MVLQPLKVGMPMYGNWKVIMTVKWQVSNEAGTDTNKSIDNLHSSYRPMPIVATKQHEPKPLLEILAVVNDEMVEEWELKEQET